MTQLPLPDEFKFTKKTLSNGLDVVVRRQDALPLVAVNLWYHVGSKDEERTQRGYAHLFEHLMFEGSEHFPGDFFQPLQRLGANVNGSTSADRTNYFEDLPAAHLELALAMESDRMGFLLPALGGEKLRVQKDVVKNEYRQNYTNRPYGQVSRILAEAMYPPDHPYSWLTIGAMEDVEAASLDDVHAFFRRNYVPANASLAIVGDVDVEHAFERADRFFGSIPGGARALPRWTPDVDFAKRCAPTGVFEIELRENVELDRVYLSWHTRPQFQPDDAELALLADILARGRASRLFRRLVLDEQLAQDVSAYQSGRELAGSFGIVVTLRPGREWKRAVVIIDQELEAIARGDNLSETELERARNGRVAGFVYALDNIGGFGGVADRLNAYNTFLRDPARITDDVRRFTTPAIDDIARVAKAYVWERPHVRLVVTGRGKKSTAAAAIDRTAPPIADEPKVFIPPKPETRRLACGAELWVIRRGELPIVAGTIAIRAGASAHGVDRAGLASLTANMMDEGTKSRTAQALASSIEHMGTSLSSNCGWDGSYVSVQCLANQLDPSLDIALDVLLEPSFPESEYRRVLAQHLAGLKAERDSADSVASRAFIERVYGARHPYSLPVDGSETTVEPLTTGDLREFHRSRYRPGEAVLVFAGDVEIEPLSRKLDARFAGWEKAAEPVRADDSARPPSHAILLIHRPGAVQAVVRIGHAGTARDDPDFENLTVFNHILGGQFTSRLNEVVREQKGLTYGIRSQFDFRRGPGPFVISASLQADRLAEALAVIRHELEAMLDHRPITRAELIDAQRSIIEGQARHFETPASLVSRYAGLFLYDLPIDHHAGLAERISGVTAESATAAARRLLRPDAMLTVVVADAADVRAQLDGLDWGPVDLA